MQQGTSSGENPKSFTTKVWIVMGIVSLSVVCLLLLKATFSVLLLVLAGALIAIFFRGLTGLICRKTKWKEGICLTLSFVGSLIIVVSLAWLIGSKVQEQAAELGNTLPSTIENAKTQLSRNEAGKFIVRKVSSQQFQTNARQLAETFLKSTFGILGDIYVVLFIGMFFSVSPNIYTKGIITLIPNAGKERADRILSELGFSLRKWMKGKMFAMLVVFVLTAIGLAVMGMPMWLVLAIIAGILNFIPNFGPMIAMVPALLVALLQGPETAGIVCVLYILVQVIESNFITPLVQQKLISIPPALIIIAQLLISPLTGGWGLVLATPVMVIIMVLVQELYIKKQNR